MIGTALLLILFVFTIVYKALFKHVSGQFDARVVPIFVSVWVLIGLAATAPVFFQDLWVDKAWPVYAAAPWLLALAAFKGILLYISQTQSQKLMRASMSASLYIAPMAIGLLAIVNSFLGEHLSAPQWFAAISVALLSCAFFFRGHLNEASPEIKRVYAICIVIAVTLGAIDQIMVPRVNWYGLLLPSNVMLLALGLFSVRGEWHIAGHALVRRTAVLAGASFALVELVKFYQTITFNPVTAVVVAQNLTNPVLLVMSALVWKERTVREQLIWGGLAVALSLPLFLG